jgi:hypothetical protein
MPDVPESDSTTGVTMMAIVVVHPVGENRPMSKSMAIGGTAPSAGRVEEADK